MNLSLILPCLKMHQIIASLNPFYTTDWDRVLVALKYYRSILVLVVLDHYINLFYRFYNRSY
ncbi:hypothetical protein RchiOBHm_Chr4g0413191 [Rosa chinensis]|uniref:Uncharacterized protein n=1 Tax=Rosa chinensis TaxID=74649 RepID=A0A2P6QW41_ROSCH|nr:hypothetical protein RchiOBHm_Chr4g0413191 [Rosa chinensis]